jgi:hypothetical protein
MQPYHNEALNNMLNRSQIYTLLILRNRGNNIFSGLDNELICHISDFGQDENNSAATLLHQVAYGNEKNVKAMLDANPRLVLAASNVVTPSGLTVMRVTPYECALGAGDPEMAELIGAYFSQKEIENGEKEKTEQYERYRSAIKSMLRQKPYDLGWLIDIIKQSSATDVVAALRNRAHESLLRDALVKFRNDLKPGKMTKAGMHFNYSSLEHAYDLYEREFYNLTNGDNYDKCRLVWRQLIGYEMRNLPECDRRAFARSLYDEVVKNKESLKKSFKFINDFGDFPVTAGDDSHSGLGFDFAMDIFGYSSQGARAPGWGGPYVFRTYVEQKNSNLQNLCNHAHERKRPRV